MIKLSELKKLREQTGVSYSLCKEALEKSKGDKDKALEILRKQGAHVAEKKSIRTTHQGAIFAYIHHNKRIGAMLCMLCETDFVAKNSDFQKLGNQIAMQITCVNPKDVKELLRSPYIKDESITIKELLDEYILKLQENIKISEFKYYNLA